MVEGLAESLAAELDVGVPKAVVRLRAQGDDTVSPVFQFEETRSSFIQLMALDAARMWDPGISSRFGPDKINVMDVTGLCGKPVSPLIVKLSSMLGSNNVFQRVRGQSHVQGVRVHLAKLIIFSGDELIHTVIMELQHP
eukprot:TRINITY_DN66001_c0_g2_i1.p5 TRINITY_DN66001_c0_g2~~TRINITY_DN66001_c0_g2_i1.p5  ORF type:complete len:139 (+),score=16.66 TRINITY_DN66001_c0_g2_i1:65-481(+)